MKKAFKTLMGIMALLTVVSSCNKYETYAEQKDKERNAISQMIRDSSMTVISESQFRSQDSTTDVSKNEWVLFESNGVYMQIVRKGCGQQLKNGETATVLCRFTEKNLLTDSLILTNDVRYYAPIVDKMSVTRSSDTYTASFIAGSSLMYSRYGTASVPAGWLVPMSYIRLGRREKEGDEIAKVKLIVPHTQGTQMATTNVYPCYYVITYERGI